MTIQSWIQHWSEHVDVLLLRVCGDLKELGVYAQMQPIVGVRFSLSVRSLDQIANAAYSSDRRNPAALRRSVLVFAALMLGASASALTIIYLFASLFGATLVVERTRHFLRKNDLRSRGRKCNMISMNSGVFIGASIALAITVGLVISLNGYSLRLPMSSSS